MIKKIKMLYQSPFFPNQSRKMFYGYCNFLMLLCRQEKEVKKLKKGWERILEAI